jgi:hypothetical protein
LAASGLEAAKFPIPCALPPCRIDAVEFHVPVLLYDLNLGKIWVIVF